MDIFIHNELYEILKYCDYETIKAFCLCNKQINYYYKNNQSIQILILKEKNKKISYLTDIFLSNVQNKHYALILACQFNNTNIAQELINRGYDPSFCNNRALIEACKNRNLTIVKLLCQDSRILINNYKSPLNIACKNNDLAIVDYLLNNAKINDSNVYTVALFKACKYGYLHIVDRLLQDPKVDPTILIEKRYINSGHSLSYTLLHDSNWDPYFKIQTPLTVVCEKGHLLVVHRLLQDSRVDPSILNNKAIFQARKNNHSDIVNRLIRDPRINPNILNFYLIKTFIKSNLHMLYAGAGAMQTMLNVWKYGDS